MGNFLAVHRVRPSDEAAANCDDENADTVLKLNEASLRKALEPPAPEDPPHAKKQGEAQEDLTQAALSQANATWASALPAAEQDANPYERCSAKALLQAARRKKPKRCFACPEEESASPPGVLQHEGAKKAEAVKAWLKDVATRRGVDGRAFLNPEQLSFAQKVAERVVAEEECGEGEQLRQVGKTDPLRWALHGGPGTGKSHTLRVVREELFDQVLGWQQGVQYKVVAFQAVMADQLAGDTIHHAVGLNKHGDETGVSLQRMAELLAGATRWRWLLLDEISMVSAELLARFELRCRELVRDACKEKYGPHSNAARPFGGVNVILAGDMWQLEPPRGTFLGAIPAEMLRRRGQKTKLPHAAYGRGLCGGDRRKAFRELQNWCAASARKMRG